MKANELMIGDWVCYATRPFRIDGISIGGFSVHSDKEGWQSIADVAPIPLTEEILKKNGFNYTGGGDETMMCVTPFNAPDTRYNLYVGLKHKTIDVYAAYPEQKKPNWRKHNKVEFELCDCAVHELQQALRLCRIEKEIVL